MLLKTFLEFQKVYLELREEVFGDMNMDSFNVILRKSCGNLVKSTEFTVTHCSGAARFTSTQRHRGESVG